MRSWDHEYSTYYRHCGQIKSVMNSKSSLKHSLTGGWCWGAAGAMLATTLTTHLIICCVVHFVRCQALEEIVVVYSSCVRTLPVQGVGSLSLIQNTTTTPQHQKASKIFIQLCMTILVVVVTHLALSQERWTVNSERVAVVRICTY